MHAQGRRLRYLPGGAPPWQQASAATRLATASAGGVLAEHQAGDFPTPPQASFHRRHAMSMRELRFVISFVDSCSACDKEAGVAIVRVP